MILCRVLTFSCLKSIKKSSIPDLYLSAMIESEILLSIRSNNSDLTLSAVNQITGLLIVEGFAKNFEFSLADNLLILKFLVMDSHLHVLSLKDILFNNKISVNLLLISLSTSLYFFLISSVCNIFRGFTVFIPKDKLISKIKKQFVIELFSY